MPGMRIEELAQTLNRASKEVLDYLRDRKIEVKSHKSVLTAQQERMVREAFEKQADVKKEGKRVENTEAKTGNKTEGKTEGAKTEVKKTSDRPKRTSNLIRVDRPQNAMTREGKNFHRTKPHQAAGDKTAREKARPLREKTAQRPSAQAGNVQTQPVSAPEKKPDGRPQEAPQAAVRPAQTEPAAGKEQTESRSAESKRTDHVPQEAERRETRSRDGREGRDGQRGVRRDGQRSDGPRSDGQRSDGARGDGQRGRRDGQRSDGTRSDGPRGPRDGQRGPRDGQRDGQRGRRDGQRSDGARRDGQRDQNRTEQAGSRRFGDRTQGGGEGRRFDRDARSGGRDGRSDGARRDGRRDSRQTSSESMDLGLKKPIRDARTGKEKDKEKEREREEKKTQDRKTSGIRPGQGRRPNQKSPKPLQKPERAKPKEEKKEEIREIILPEKMTIRELAEKMKMQPSVIVKKLFMEGVMVTVNNEIDFEKAQEIALSFDILAEQEEKVDVIGELLKEEEEDEATMTARPPVVCVMGHVDHGKTSLLDAIRKTNVTSHEAGGITQHIGASVVSIRGQKITFLDTPGHEAFTAMRMRGANSTDIAVLVVAADDGVMPQTIEAINHAKAAGVEIIVAVNKIDKPGANVERVKQEMTEYGLIPEDWGGSTVFVEVSAKTGAGISDLLEMILLTAEVMELKANPKRRARGLVIEAKLDKGKGPVASILVQKGTLHVGDFIAAGACSGKVRAMMDDKGRRVKEAGPSMPVEVLGLSDVPNAGEVLVVLENDKDAKHFAATFISENRNRLLEETKSRMSLDDLFSKIQEGNLKELNLVVKADVQGSVEAVKQSLLKLSNEEVVVKVIHGGVGAINESDVTLASASNAIIIGFNVRPDATAKQIAEQEGVDLRLYRVIYQAIEDIEAAMKGMLDPIFEEKVIGHAEIRQIFKASGVGNIGGSYVLDGVLQRGCLIRISREGSQIYEGKLASLKRFKDDVKEVKSGFECGLVFDGFNDIAEFDIVEAYIMVEVPR